MSLPRKQDAKSSFPVSFPVGATGSGKNVILVSEKQRGNPLLKYIRNVQWEFSKEIIPDYVMGFTCAIFLSIKYHSLHSKHAELRIRELGKLFRLRILLVLVDVDDDISVKPLHELNKLCFNNDVTLLLCWSNEECARYLETLKVYENKSASSIQEKVENEFVPQLNKVLTNVRSVNKTDVVTLLDVFGNLSGICAAKEQELILVPGLGDKKVKRLYQALHEPFRSVKPKVKGNSSSSSGGGGSSSSSSSSSFSASSGGSSGGDINSNINSDINNSSNNDSNSNNFGSNINNNDNNNSSSSSSSSSSNSSSDRPIPDSSSSSTDVSSNINTDNNTNEVTSEGGKPPY